MRRHGAFLASSLREVALRHMASKASSSYTTAAAAAQAAKEDEEDKRLEEEEFRVMEEAAGDEYLPIAHRLAGKADAQDMELRRIRWALLESQQLVVDTAGATISGRPTRMHYVCGKVRAAYAKKIMAEQQEEAAQRKSAEEAAAATGRMGEGSDSTSMKGKAKKPIVKNEDNHFDVTTSRGRTKVALDPPLNSETLAAYANWRGTSSPLVRAVARVLNVSSMRPFQPPTGEKPSSAAVSSSSHGGAIITDSSDVDYLRNIRAMHALNYYSRMILTPKRHIGHAVYHVIWNAWIAITNSIGCICFGAMRGAKNRGWIIGGPLGALCGVGKAVQFLFYGWVLSPLIHIPRGLANSVYGPLNFLWGKYFFDAQSGRWMQCSVLDCNCFKHNLQLEKRLIRAIGRVEYKRKKMHVESKWLSRMSSMGITMEAFQHKFRGRKDGSGNDSSARVENPYEVLQVRRAATTQQIKAQYKKLAMVFHPDVVENSSARPLTDAERAAAQDKFAAISDAYQVLSNPEKRKAYDLGGARGLEMHESRYGTFMARTPEQVVQSVFGGEAFRSTLTGEMLRSHWSLRNEAQVSVSLHELEQLQCIRVRQLASNLASIVDVHARRPTTPYHRNVSSSFAAGGGGGGIPRRVKMSGLPDPFGRNSITTTHSGGIGGTQGAGGKKVVDLDMESAMLEELGEMHHKGSSSSKKQQPHKKKAEASNTATEDKTSESAYALKPGSNEYNCFSRDFEERCDVFVGRLADACFGRELLFEIGEAYVVGAQRFLGVRPFYAPKVLQTRKIFSGMDRISSAFKDKINPNDKEELARKIMLEYFAMEYDSIVTDLQVCLRYTVQLVLQDVVESEEVRKKRCYALWLLGEKMLAKGSKSRWNDSSHNDAELIAYIQQAAHSAATTSKPPAF